jgi:hypothetical protein
MLATCIAHLIFIDFITLIISLGLKSCDIISLFFFNIIVFVKAAEDLEIMRYAALSYPSLKSPYIILRDYK